MNNKIRQALRTKFLVSAMTGLAAACLVLCGNETQAQVTITGIYPNGTYQFQTTNALAFTASSSAGISPTSIMVQLIGTGLPGQGFVNNLTSTNGLTVT